MSASSLPAIQIRELLEGGESFVEGAAEVVGGLLQAGIKIQEGVFFIAEVRQPMAVEKPDQQQCAELLESGGGLGQQH